LSCCSIPWKNLDPDIVENGLLRRQLAVLNRQVKRPKLTWRDRSIIDFLASKLRGWKDALMIVQPETLLRWHRDVFRFVWRRKSKAESKPGRPPFSDDDIARIKRLARENATWGAERIRGMDGPTAAWPQAPRRLD
jgi:hypothetical protein